MLRREVIRRKPFLRKVYEGWYSWIARNVPQGPGAVVELGSGAGFLDEYIPGLITSEVFLCPHVRVVLDGRALPFRDSSLKAVAMVDVFHHVPDVRALLQEASRCLMPGGRILMVEPWMTPFSRRVYTRLHHEPVDMEAGSWSFPSSGPLSGANTALPWIVFERDLETFRRDFPGLELEGIDIVNPFSYLLSGGVSTRSLVPGFFFPAVDLVERILSRRAKTLGMFARISVRRR